MTENLFTAAQIARALYKKRTSVYWALRDVPADSQTVESGNTVAAWKVSSLPATMREQLSHAAKRLGYASAEVMLNTPPKRWEPPIALGAIAQPCIDAAVKLQRALAPALARMNDLTLSGAEFEERGVEDYARVFGHRISTRYFRELFKRTVERDGGAEQWERLEIYLEERPARKIDLVTKAINQANGFEDLQHLIANARTPGQFSPLEEANLWTMAIENFNGQVDTGKKAKLVKRALLDFLWRNAPWLAKSENALRVSFDRKLAKWIEGDGTSLVDGRTLRKGESTAKSYEQDSIDAIVWHAGINCGGRVSQAVRDLAESEMLDPQIIHSLLRSKNKTYVPRRLRNIVRGDVKMVEVCNQGPHAVDCATPSLSMKYDGISSMRCLMADDFTFPIWFYVPDGQGWYNLTRGQCLLVIDFRTLMVLGYALLPEKQYTSVAIRTVFTRIFEERGLPEILYLERGIWQRSKLVTGGPKCKRILQEDDLPYNWSECQMGLRQFGIKFIHARRARSKPVERVGGLLQDLMEGEPGYGGREERYDRPEVLTDRMREVETKKVHPGKYFYDFHKWDARLEEIIIKYNATIQQGKRIMGLSPEEAFQKFQDTENPPTKFDASCRYRLALHKIPVEVNNNAVHFTINGQHYKYFDEVLGSSRYKRLIAWFNPELPELLTLTDMNERNPITVSRHNETDALACLTGTEEQYAEEMRKAAGFNSYMKTRYRVLKLKFKQTFRQNLVATQTIELGQEIERQRNAISNKERTEATRRDRILRKARQLNIVPATLADFSEETENRLDRQIARRRDQTAEQVGESQ